MTPIADWMRKIGCLCPPFTCRLSSRPPPVNTNTVQAIDTYIEPKKTGS